MPKERYLVGDLLSIMELLRSACPWDREQTHKSIRKNLIEEAYETAEAIDNDDHELLKEELGDLLLQVVFHAQIEKERGEFDFSDVCDVVCKKLVHRHPHIFAGVKAESSEQVLRNWEEIKKEEKGRRTVAQSLDSVPAVLPALMRSQKVQQRVAKTGFDYPDAAGAMADLASEVEEVKAALAEENVSALEEELGDLLFSVVNLARLVGVEAEESLTKSCGKFIERFKRVEALASQKSINMQTANMQILDSLWKEAKKQSKKLVEVKRT